MTSIAARRSQTALHPLHAILLAFAPSSFTGALVSDLAYWSSYEVQWLNFSAWLIVAGLIGGGFALLWALIDLFRRGTGRRGGPPGYVLALAAAWVIGFVNALVHAKDAWATMPSGLYLSAICAVLALAAAWIGHSGHRAQEVG